MGADGAAAVVTGMSEDETGPDGDAAAALEGANAGDEGSKPSAGEYTLLCQGLEVACSPAHGPSLSADQICFCATELHGKGLAPRAEPMSTAGIMAIAIWASTWPQHQQEGG